MSKSKNPALVGWTVHREHRRRGSIYAIPGWVSAFVLAISSVTGGCALSFLPARPIGIVQPVGAFVANDAVSIRALDDSWTFSSDDPSFPTGLYVPRTAAVYFYRYPDGDGDRDVFVVDPDSSAVIQRSQEVIERLEYVAQSGRDEDEKSRQYEDFQRDLALSTQGPLLSFYENVSDQYRVVVDRAGSDFYGIMMFFAIRENADVIARRRWQVEIPNQYFETARNGGLSVVYGTYGEAERPRGTSTVSIVRVSWVLWLSDFPLWGIRRKRGNRFGKGRAMRTRTLVSAILAAGLAVACSLPPASQNIVHDGGPWSVLPLVTTVEETQNIEVATRAIYLRTEFASLVVRGRGVYGNVCNTSGAVGGRSGETSVGGATGSTSGSGATRETGTGGATGSTGTGGVVESTGTGGTTETTGTGGATGDTGGRGQSGATGTGGAAGALECMRTDRGYHFRSPLPGTVLEFDGVGFRRVEVRGMP